MGQTSENLSQPGRGSTEILQRGQFSGVVQKKTGQTIVSDELVLRT